MIEATFVFIDLAGFTALTETHGDEQAADLAEQFHGIAREALGPGDVMVKSIGDAVMLTSPAPGPALDLVGRVVGQCLDTAEFPVVRSGLHHGKAAQRGDDVFGAAVNLAARVAAQASGGQTLATADVAAAARRRGLPVAELGPRRFRNVSEPVPVFEVQLRAMEQETVIDPVCRMRVTPTSAAGHLRYDGASWWFCSLDCAGRFSADPDHYQRALGE